MQLKYNILVLLVKQKPVKPIISKSVCILFLLYSEENLYGKGELKLGF